MYDPGTSANSEFADDLLNRELAGSGHALLKQEHVGFGDPIQGR